MNVKQTIARLEDIAEANKQAVLLSTLLTQRDPKAPKGVRVEVYGAKGEHYDNHGRQCIIDADLLQEAINKTAERSTALAEKLQPVVDMADAALKGILATGDTQ